MGTEIETIYTKISWYQAGVIQPKSYVCGHCGKTVGPDKGYHPDNFGGPAAPAIYICSFCSRPTYCEGQEQIPGASYGHPVSHVPSAVSALYEEARKCTSVSAHTCAVMACRKILMNVAVTEKAPEGKSFAYYVDYLCEKGIVPAKGREWAAHIKDKGNAANHEIEQMSRPEAEELIKFVEMLLKVNYEYTASIATQEPATKP